MDKDSVAEAWHEVTGFMYFTYTLIYDGRKRAMTKDTYTLDLETGEVQITEKPGKEKKNDRHDKVVRKSAAGRRDDI